MKAAIQWLIYGVLRALFATYRIEQMQVHYRPNHTQAADKKRVIALWHEQLLMTLNMGREMPMVTVASRSKDGRLIGWILGKLGFDTVYGSSNRGRANKPGGKDRGGQSVLRELVERVGAGQIAAVTVDGSIGPRREVKKGVAYTAQMTGCQVVPVGCVADKYWEFNTWDKLKLPKPFAKITLCYGRPIDVPRDVSPEELKVYQKQIGQGINSCEVRALLASHNQPLPATIGEGIQRA